MIHETILAIVIVFAISALFCPVIIPFLHKLKFEQQVRDKGPQGHLKEQGTSITGGLIILSSIIITSVFYTPNYPRITPVLFVTVGFGIIGFLDDYIEIVMKRPEGLKPIQKLVGQFIITGIFAWCLLNSGEMGTDVLIPFTGGFDRGSFLSLGIFFAPVLSFIMLGTDNEVNFTDGLDGLCTNVTILVATFLTIVAIDKDVGISPITGAMVGSLLGSLLFNIYPAEVFTGDIGSSALGGSVAAPCYVIRVPLFIPVIGLTYLVEVLSVIIQVTYSKRTGSKRIFKMAPTHRHFELCGWSEIRAIAVFAIVTTILYMVAYLGLQVLVSHVRGQNTISKCS